MTTRLYLARHGATPSTAEDRFSGGENVPLSEEGCSQAQRLAERLADYNITAAYSSPLDRTMATANIIAQPHGVIPIPRVELREITHGHWEGLSRAEVEEKFADEYAAWEADPFTFAPEGGESGIAVLARALPVIREIVQNHKDQNILVVSHKATLRLILCSLLGIDARGYRDRLDQSPASLNILDFKDAIHARLMLFNDISHYANHPRRPQKHLSRWWDGASE
ncbi:MAG: 2,3-bisphosphoglycerate-dependent phosphoglycerate mutase [Anaerolineales bacterium]|nr:2,3-bisphosphoglycerate-dependent phosphoglycerate mutase [Anaerolineales bacterium]